MRVQKIRLQNFKRFTDLTVDALPASARLVLVVGPNGHGKSSLFDGLLKWYMGKAGFGQNNDQAYYPKLKQEAASPNGTITVALHNGEQPTRGCLYIRTAYRHDPDFSVSSFNRPAPVIDSNRFNRLIDADQTVSENYQRLAYQTMSGVYDTKNDAKTVKDLREQLIGELRVSMKNVFADLVVNSISDPLADGSFFFEKGTSKSYHYKNISGGEKAAFDLLLDFHIRKGQLTNTVWCVDELETHLHTKVQGQLLKELVAVLPVESQLWVTTHSLGVLRAAKELLTATPGSVAIIDFHDVDPDVACDLRPSSLDRVSWGKLLSIALDDLSYQVAPKHVVVCEGSSAGNRRKDFDAEIYDRILASTTPGVAFVAGGSSNQVAATGVSVQSALGRMLPAAKVVALRDRDDMSPAQVAAFEANTGLVLKERNLESYLFADDVLDALVATVGGDATKRAAVLQVRADALAASVARGNAPDDFKSAAGQMFTEIRKVLGLTRCGDDTAAFMRDTLAPLVKPGMATFDALKREILDRL